jgi:acetyl-CoA carboxylase biotin carboxyl carrier protein
MTSPDEKDIESLVELFNQSDWDEMHLKTDTLEIFLSNDPHASGPAQSTATALSSTVGESAAQPIGSSAAAESPAEPGSPAVTEVAEGLLAVRAPNLGTFYRAPKPGAPAYVEVGQSVEADTEVCLIEVMKLFTPVRAGNAGTVREICIADGQMVEFGQLLVTIEPQT